MQLTFEFKRPASHYVGGNRAGNERADVAQFPYHPDIDNLSKFVLDAIEDVMCNNDGNIVELFAKKCTHPLLPAMGGFTW